MQKSPDQIHVNNMAAIILAAGLSSRFGQPKVLMPWHETTVIEHIITIVMGAGISNIHVVTGGDREKVEPLLKSLPVKINFNENYRNLAMISSIQTGIKNLGSSTNAVLILLGDQPVVEVETINLLIHEYNSSDKELVVPLYQGHKGHPWLLGRKYWDEILGMSEQRTLRNFLHEHEKEIDIVMVNSHSVLQDFDTVQEYQNLIEKSVSNR
jgi:molybdenum cofactor cytidylyltransferase